MSREKHGVEEGRRIRVNEAWWRTSRVAFCHRGQEKSIGQESINNNPREGKQRLFRFVDLRVAARGPARVLCPVVASDTEASRFILAKELRERDENSLPFYLAVGSRNYTERVFLSTFVRILKVYRCTVCTSYANIYIKHSKCNHRMTIITAFNRSETNLSLRVTFWQLYLGYVKGWIFHVERVNENFITIWLIDSGFVLGCPKVSFVL